jgi:NAD(P)-dependent dehydrogenase (short-subunit alcohol dehydrogenase family)
MMLIIGGTTANGIGEAVDREAKIRGCVTEVPSRTMLDVSDPHSVHEFFANNDHDYSQVVYAAGIQVIGTLSELSIHDIRDIYSVNVLGFIDVLSHLVKRQDHGRVCAVSSDAGRIAMTGSIGYCSSKAAMSHAIRCAARELKQHWQITGVAPGVVDGTALTNSVDAQVMKVRGWTQEDLLNQEQIRRPFGRRVTPDEVAWVVLDMIGGPMTLSGTITEINGGV